MSRQVTTIERTTQAADGISVADVVRLYRGDEDDGELLARALGRRFCRRLERRTVGTSAARHARVSRSVNQDAANHLGRYGEEMRAVLSIDTRSVTQAADMPRSLDRQSSRATRR